MRKYKNNLNLNLQISPNKVVKPGEIFECDEDLKLQFKDIELISEPSSQPDEPKPKTRRAKAKAEEN